MINNTYQYFRFGQIEKFLMDTIYAPLLLNFTVLYPEGFADESTNTSSGVLRKGSEFVITGRLNGMRNIEAGDLVPVSVTGVDVV